MWTYSIEDAFGREVAHGEEKTIKAMADRMIEAGRTVRLFAWRPGTR